MSEIRLLHIVRDGKELGKYFLSFVELCLRHDEVGDGDLGWVEGMGEWVALPVLANELRMQAGPKALTTAKQKKLLNERGFTPWRGMAREEAAVILETAERGQEVPTDHWEKVPKAKTTLAQKAHLEFLGATEFPDSREDAEMLIFSLNVGSGNVDYDASDEVLLNRIAELKKRVSLLKKWIIKGSEMFEIAEARYDLKELEGELDDIQMTIKHRKEERLEDARFEREERREYIAGLQWEMGAEGHWSDHIRKPTIAQVTECLLELEKEKPDWEDEFAMPLYQKLIQKFPNLKKLPLR